MTKTKIKETETETQIEKNRNRETMTSMPRSSAIACIISPVRSISSVEIVI